MLRIHDHWALVPNWDIQTNFPLSRFRKVFGKSVKAQGWGRVLKQGIFWIWQAIAPKSSPQLWFLAQDKIKPIKIPTWMGQGLQGSTLNWGAMGCWGKGAIFLQWCRHWQVACVARNNPSGVLMQATLNSEDHKTGEWMKGMGEWGRPNTLPSYAELSRNLKALNKENNKKTKTKRTWMISKHPSLLR